MSVPRVQSMVVNTYLRVRTHCTSINIGTSVKCLQTCYSICCIAYTDIGSTYPNSYSYKRRFDRVGDILITSEQGHRDYD